MIHWLARHPVTGAWLMFVGIIPVVAVLAFVIESINGWLDYQDDDLPDDISLMRRHLDDVNGPRKTYSQGKGRYT